MRLKATGMAFALALLAMTGCGSVQVIRPAAPAQPVNTDLAQASELARRVGGLRGQERADTARLVEQLLARLDDQALAEAAAALPEGDPLYTFAGRALMARGLPLPPPFDAGMLWRAQSDSRPPADADGYRPPEKLAVLLPLSGHMATAASPVRDGLLAGYYAERRQRPEIVFHDTGGTPGGAMAAYQRAVAEGADYVVGPLGRDEVAAVLADPSRLQVPVLALNRAGDETPTGSFSFAMASEDDGIAAANRLLSQNVQRVLVLAGGDDSARRSVEADR